MSKWSNIEASLGLRVVTSAMALTGILAACQLAETTPALTWFGLAGTIIGSTLSYHRRTMNNFWIKWALAAGILVVLGLFVENILYRIQSSIADARAPLTNMLIALQALHSFDLPKRRDLSVSALVGLTLIASAATLSRDLSFAVYLFAFIVFGSYMLYLNCISQTAEGTQLVQPIMEKQDKTLVPWTGHTLTRASRLSALGLVLLLPLMALVLFLVFPQADLSLLRNVRVSINLNLPFLRTNGITNPMLSRARRGDGSLEVNPLAYFGFNNELDLNYRGCLGKDIVLKIASPRGHLWRAMAFDTYDGHRWTMSQPDTTFDRLTMAGAAIPLAPVPSLTVPRRVSIIELNQVFHLEADHPNIIPAASVPYLIYFPTNKVQVDTYGSLRSPVIMEKDMVYTVFSHVPMYNLEVLREALPVEAATQIRLRKRLANYFQLPHKLPWDVTNLGRQAAGSSGNWFVKAERLSNFLKLNYRYNLMVPPTANNKDAVTEFLLEAKSGYCEHFASAFVVLCRSQGIPARLVTGFTPGDYNPFTGLWEVRMHHAHAWAEVFLPRWGWIAFDPTPDGVAPAFQGLTRQSALGYIEELIKDWLRATLAQPAVSGALQAIARYLSPLGIFIQWLTFFAIALWQPLVVLMALIAVAFMTTQRLLLLRQTRSRDNRHPDTSATSGKRGEATQQFVLVCNDLTASSIARLPHETANELMEKVSLSALQKDSELVTLIGAFLGQYTRARFGKLDGVGNLEQISAKIHEKLSLYSPKVNVRPLEIPPNEINADNKQVNNS